MYPGRLFRKGKVLLKKTFAQVFSFHSHVKVLTLRSFVFLSLLIYVFFLQKPESVFLVRILVENVPDSYSG